MALELRMRRRFAAGADQVWQGLTSPAAIEQWFWPARFATKAEADVKVGGRLRIDGMAGGIAVSGRYVTIEPPRLLSFTWIWDGEPEQTLVTAELAEADGQTELELAHGGFANEAARDDHVTGWSDCLDRLAAWLSS
jgi:uncharacterized protein YndB with AHSA1/START domain